MDNKALNNTLNSRIGEKATMHCGMTATIIKYNNNRDIDVEFEDGSIATNKRYSAFLNGHIAYPKKKKKTTRRAPRTGIVRKMRASRVGMVRKMCNGQYAEITAYRRSDDIDVKFEDGSMATNKTYDAFLSGHISAQNKSNKLPKKVKTTEQEKEDNIYDEFEAKPAKVTEKIISAPEKLGMTKIMKNGQLAAITEYRNDDDIDVMFEDGTVVTNERFYFFMTGKIVNPNIISAQPQISEAETPKSSDDNDLLSEISDKADVLEVSDSSTDTVDSSDFSESFDDSKLFKDDITGFSCENDSSDKVLKNFTFEDLKDIPETEIEQNNLFNEASSLKEIAINPTFLYDLLTDKTKSNTTNLREREPGESIPKTVDIREDVPYNTNRSKLSNDIIFGKYDKILGIKNNPMKKGEFFPLMTDDKPVASKKDKEYSENKKYLETAEDGALVNTENFSKRAVTESEKEKAAIYNCLVTDTFMTLMEFDKTGACCPDLYYIFSFEGQKDCSVALTTRELAYLIYMDIVTVDKDDICLEDMTSKYVRLECTSDRVKRIGHIFHDKWVEISNGEYISDTRKEDQL